MSLDSKGQASAELILATVVFMVIALSLIQLASSEMDKTSAGNLGQARMVGEAMAETINTVYINGPGYSINMTLPNNFTYTASVVPGTGNSTLYINYSNQIIPIKLIPSNISSKNMNSGQTYIVKNNNGTIVFT